MNSEGDEKGFRCLVLRLHSRRGDWDKARETSFPIQPSFIFHRSQS